MNWLPTLFTNTSIVGILFALVLVGAVGLWLGRIRIAGVQLGVACVLFMGIAWNVCLWGTPSSTTSATSTANLSSCLVFLRDFGLILFVYAIGLTVGPGFFDRLRAHGLQWNVLAIFVIALGCGVTIATHYFLALPGSLSVGLLTGATTNTPSLAAAGQALTVERGDNSVDQAINLAAAGYAITYPLGIIGTIAVIMLLRRIIGTPRHHSATTETVVPPLARRSFKITNPGVQGLTLQSLCARVSGRIIISRFMRNNTIVVAQPTEIIHLNDVILGVGAAEDLDELLVLCGSLSDVDLMSYKNELQVRSVLMSSRDLSLKTLASVHPLDSYGVTVTRITRAGVELIATENTTLHLGDRLRVVGSAADLARFAQVVGDSPRDMETPDLVPVFIGISLGVLIGSIPIFIPGIPAAIKLGLAGGPLLVALLLASRGQFGPFDTFLPSASILFMKEIGIVIFLACVGLLSGDAFLTTLSRPDGLLLLGVGAAITIIPLLLIGLFAHFFLRKSYGEIAGLLAGSMTDPPGLAFAQASVSDESPSRVYATVYPFSMLLRIICAQLLMLWWSL
jgi:putative transport protein